MARSYNVPEAYMVVSNAAKFINYKYQIADEELRSKIYRKILKLAKNGKYGGKKYKNGRIWMIKKSVIPHIEQELQLSIKKKKVTDKNGNAIKNLVQSCIKNGLDEKQSFNLIKDFLFPGKEEC
ncbi:MAG: hypothetical protein ACOCRK_09665 [bacterium]